MIDFVVQGHIYIYIYIYPTLGVHHLIHPCRGTKQWFLIKTAMHFILTLLFLLLDRFLLWCCWAKPDNGWWSLCYYIYIYIYIYAFSRCFYPKRLTLHSRYSLYILSALDFPGNRTHDLGVASAMLYQLSYRKAPVAQLDCFISPFISPQFRLFYKPLKKSDTGITSTLA